MMLLPAIVLKSSDVYPAYHSRRRRRRRLSLYISVSISVVVHLPPTVFDLIRELIQ